MMDTATTILTRRQYHHDNDDIHNKPFPSLPSLLLHFPFTDVQFVDAFAAIQKSSSSSIFFHHIESMTQCRSTHTSHELRCAARMLPPLPLRGIAYDRCWPCYVSTTRCHLLCRSAFRASPIMAFSARRITSALRPASPAASNSCANATHSSGPALG